MPFVQLVESPYIQAGSGNAEAAVPGTTIDLSQTDFGVAGWFIAETGGVNGIKVWVQQSPDNVTWFAGPVANVAKVLAALGQALVGYNTVNNTACRYVRLSLQDSVAGNHGILTVYGGFGK